MSTWTSDLIRAPVCALAGLLLLGGCFGELSLPRLEFAPRPDSTLDRIEVARGAVVIAGPRGYCVDRQGSRPGNDPAFVLLGACDAIAGDVPATRPIRRAILTATVVALPAGAALPAPDVVAGFLQSEDGRTMLSRSGDAAQVEILASIVSADTVLMRIRDRGRLDGPRVADTYWRAVFAHDRHMVTLAVLAPAGTSIASASQRVLLEQFIDRVRAVNATESDT